MKKHGFLYYLFIEPFLLLFTFYKHLFTGLSRLLEYVVDNFIYFFSKHPLKLRSLAYRIKELISYCYRRSIIISRVMYISILTFNIVLMGLIFNSCVTVLQYIAVSILFIFILVISIIIASLIFRAIDRKHDTADTTALEIAVTEDISDEISTDINNEDSNTVSDTPSDVNADNINKETIQVTFEIPEEHLDNIPNNIMPPTLTNIEDLQTNSPAAEDFIADTDALRDPSAENINEENSQVTSEIPEELLDNIPNNVMPSTLTTIDDVQTSSPAAEDFNVVTDVPSDSNASTINEETTEIDSRISDEHLVDIPNNIMPSILTTIEDLQTNSPSAGDFIAGEDALSVTSAGNINEETVQVTSEIPKEHFDDSPKDVSPLMQSTNDIHTAYQCPEVPHADIDALDEPNTDVIMHSPEVLDKISVPDELHMKNHDSNSRTYNNDLNFISSCLHYVRNRDNLEDEYNNTHITFPDATFENVGKYAISKNEITVQMIQNEFNISFFSACSIADTLEKYGVIGPERKRHPRRILMSLDEFNHLLATTTINSDDAPYENSNDTSINYDNMSGIEFEHFCADILRKNGFINVEVTQGSGDHGVDILAEKDTITYAIQCKRYSSNVGNKAVQQASSGKLIYGKDIAVVLTNQYFTPQAIEDANSLKVKLWNRNFLNKLVQNANNPKSNTTYQTSI